jgi:Arc/MetJ-type ribon-helix-helix transcriptional regulator
MKIQIQLTEVAAEMLKALTKQSKYRTETDFINSLITELYFKKKK